MDSRLEERLIKWHEQIEVLEHAEREYLAALAEEKTIEGSIYLVTSGKTVDERKSQTYSSKEWGEFKADLANKEVSYRRERRLLELKIKAYEAEYLEYKLENEAIKKGFGGAP